MLFDKLSSYVDKVALIDEHGRAYSYRELTLKVNEISAKIGKQRKLIFLIVNNNFCSVATYIACVTCKHPVLLLNPDSSKQNNYVIAQYSPNLIIDCSNNEVEINHCDSTELSLHPELCILLSTSGSTGSPKLVKVSQTNISANTESIIEYLSLSDTDRTITSLKFNYSYGLSVINTHLHCGGSIVLTDTSVTDGKFWQLAQQHQITSLSGVPYTYELLSRQSNTLNDLANLRYLAQAGGKLAPELIQKFATLCSERNANFFVMYGQTEASPRISYLPPEYALEFPSHIGVPVPNGRLKIIDTEGNFIEQTDTPGELVYQGPNVMMGYAKAVNDLNTKETIDWLKTGDIAEFNQHGLFKIVGRSSRFVKPFGVRINLDDIQAYLSTTGVINAVSNVDEQIVIGIEIQSESPQSIEEIKNGLSTNFKIANSTFTIYPVKSLPLLANGKIDYTEIKNLHLNSKEHQQEKADIKTFFKILGRELLLAAGLKKHQRNNVLEIYIHHFPHKNVEINHSFSSLSGDSLSYVSISLELEGYLGKLPYNWHEKTIKELELSRE